LPLVLALAIATWAWRRRRKPLPVAAPARSRAASHDRLERWIAAGEVSLALDHLLSTLPDDASTREWREAVEVVRFDPAARERLLQLVRQGMSRLPRETRAG